MWHWFFVFNPCRDSLQTFPTFTHGVQAKEPLYVATMPKAWHSSYPNGLCEERMHNKSLTQHLDLVYCIFSNVTLTTEWWVYNTPTQWGSSVGILRPQKENPMVHPLHFSPSSVLLCILLQSPTHVIRMNIGGDKNVVTLPSDKHSGLAGRQQWNWGKIHKETDSGKPLAASSPPTIGLHSLASVQVLNFDLVCWEHWQYSFTDLNATALPECWYRCEKSVSRLTLRGGGGWGCITQLCQK
jgi:hypothetical protein